MSENVRQTGRKYTDEDGKQYLFNSREFKIAVVNWTRHHGKKRTDVYEQLGEYLHMSPDAVRKWSGSSSSPSDLDLVKEIGDFFSADYHSLLTSYNQEERTMENQIKEQSRIEQKLTEQDKALIRTMYSEFVDAAYKKLDDDHKLLDCEDVKTRVQIRNEIRKNRRREYYQSLHRIINRAGVGTSEAVLNQLHHRVIEVQYFIEQVDVPDRWYEETELDNEAYPVGVVPSMNRFERYSWLNMDREKCIEEMTIWYLQDEIALAKKWEYPDGYIRPLPQEPIFVVDESDYEGRYHEQDADTYAASVKEHGKLREFVESGFTDVFDWDLWSENVYITPQTVYMDMFTSCLTEIFKHDFPGMYEE